MFCIPGAGLGTVRPLKWVDTVLLRGCLSWPTGHVFLGQVLCWAVGPGGGELCTGPAVTGAITAIPWRRVQLNLGGIRRGQRISQKERVFEPGLEGQVSFCRLGKHGEWHPGHREGHLQRCRGGRSLKEALSLVCRRKEPLALPGSEPPSTYSAVCMVPLGPEHSTGLLFPCLGRSPAGCRAGIFLPLKVI